MIMPKQVCLHHYVIQCHVMCVNSLSVPDIFVYYGVLYCCGRKSHTTTAMLCSDTNTWIQLQFDSSKGLHAGCRQLYGAWEVSMTLLSTVTFSTVTYQCCIYCYTADDIRSVVVSAFKQ
jgi:hypothetical protein